MVSLGRWLTSALPIGVDIGSTGVRIAQLRRHRMEYELHASALVDLPPGNLENGPSDELARVLRRCLGMVTTRGRLTVAAVPDAAVEYHAVMLPENALQAAGRQAAQVIRFEVERLSTAPMDGLELDFWTLPNTNVPAPSVLGATAPRDLVLSRLQTLREAGLDCASVDASAAALCRFGVMLRPPDQQTVWGILDLGASHGTLIVCVDDTPALIRAVGTSGREWTDAVAAALNISTKSAELHKCDHGIAYTASGSSTSEPPGPVATMILGSLRTHLHEMAAEIKRSYEYVLGCYPQREVGDLMLVGGGAAMRNLPAFLHDVLAVPVRTAAEYLDEPTTTLSVPPGERARLHRFALAIGLSAGLET